MWGVRIGRIDRAVVGLALFIIGLGSSACTRKLTPRLRVAVTIFPIYDLTRTVAGPDADVALLLPPGRSLPDPSAASNRASQVSGAKLGIMIGLGLDEWMRPLLEAAAPSAHVLVLGNRVPTLTIRPADPALEAKVDPYVWLDPERAILMSKAIAEDLARADSAHAAAYRSRSFALQQRLDALDREIEARVATWTSRSFDRFHPAFAYYADRYRLAISARVEPAEASGDGIGSLDPIGGQGQVDTYEKLIRFSTEVIERLIKSGDLPPEVAAPGRRSWADGSAPP